MHENKATTESREPKDLNSCSITESDQLNNSGHKVCEYMGATHSSQHTTPDAEHSSTCCCPTHEVWELHTPLIVVNRSPQGDEVYGSYPLVLKTSILLADNNTKEASNNSTEAYTAASIPDAEHSSTCCCPNHEVWELHTPLIVVNRSPQGDEVYGELPARPQNEHPDPDLPKRHHIDPLSHLDTSPATRI
ncbi:hypothetical protein F511_06226 [Dorcoceras hygrometricum]|uniref:Uncharacterized protein n=1 Tax=Dorcoceras hygrometricum TaxID=472368 RepID=A0A2Z7CVQ5_9LAMI|nr:hypothetical protein F511_06226 [Dorcoceras hygrometricum]